MRRLGSETDLSIQERFPVSVAGNREREDRSPNSVDGLRMLGATEIFH